ncbi:PHD finger protein 6-like isoform X4 [Clinocottus analis]|uniref:PHD finger protein 6-like isoform X4 n=1 Tax=Clinocottus analis TaxID=304258 RepID=UPI0035C06219
MDGSHTVRCALCLRREETEATGPLSTKDDVTAHQNCLLFSSGLYCRHSPQFDDLFGFTVKDVLAEVKRGSKLICNKCKKKGATAGCENKRCKKSYHYPCAVKDGAKNVEDAEHGKYGLFCSYHHQMTQRHSFPVNGGASTSKSASEAGSSKVVLSTTRSCVTSEHRQRGSDGSRPAGRVQQRLRLVQHRHASICQEEVELQTQGGRAHQA